MNQLNGPAAALPQAETSAASPAPPAAAPPAERVRRPVWGGPGLVWVIAAVFVALELALSDRYGFLQDELYFIEAGRHLAFGYVDQPPLAPLLTRVTDVLGVSPAAIRIVPALAGGAIVVLAARFAARGRRLRQWLVVGATLVSVAVALPADLPVVPVAALHTIRGQDQVTMADTVGWPQLTREVAAQDATLVRAGEAPTSIFAGNYGEAGALDVLGSSYHLPPVLSGHNTFWLWGPGRASDAVVLVVDALGALRPYFASCRVLTTYDACTTCRPTGPGCRSASAPAQWPAGARCGRT
jgi:hypothetical protein